MFEQSKSHNHYQPRSVTIHLRSLGTRNWAWRICGYFYEEIERGDGCRTKKLARAKAQLAKDAYLARTEVVQVAIVLMKRKHA